MGWLKHKGSKKGFNLDCLIFTSCTGQKLIWVKMGKLDQGTFYSITPITQTRDQSLGTRDQTWGLNDQSWGLNQIKGTSDQT